MTPLQFFFAVIGAFAVFAALIVALACIQAALEGEDGPPEPPAGGPR